MSTTATLNDTTAALDELLAKLETLRDLAVPDLLAGLDKLRKLPAVLGRIEKLLAAGGLKPLLVDAEGAGMLLGISLRQVWRLRAAAEIPPPCTLGRDGTLWRVADLEAFVAAGCDIARWKAASTRR